VKPLRFRKIRVRVSKRGEKASDNIEEGPKGKKLFLRGGRRNNGFPECEPSWGKKGGTSDCLKERGGEGYHHGRRDSYAFQRTF